MKSMPNPIPGKKNLVRIAMFSLFLFSITAACASPTAIITQRRPNAEAYTPSDCDVTDDEMRVVIKDEAKKLVQYDFCSSYGEASAKLIADTRGREYLLLRYGEGRGTNARSEFLSVFLVQPGIPDLFEYMRTPVSAGASPLAYWDYDYKVLTPKEGGLRLEFHLTIDRNGESPKEEIYAPSEKYRTIVIGSPAH
jgi:hypothetical protein